MTKSDESFNQPQSSSIKHTEGGEMPQTSKIASITRRIKADASLVNSGSSSRGLIVSLVTIGFGVGAYFYAKKMTKGYSKS